MLRDMRHQNQSGKEGKGFQKIRCCLVYPIRETAQRRNWLFSAAGGPAVTILKANQVRSRYEMNETKDDARD